MAHPKRLIDPRLRAAGWKVALYDPAHPFGKGSPVAIEEFPTDNGPADYALCVEGQLLGVVEAKKLTQAILSKAFRGELVPTEAELARAEGRPYESASALLARIRQAQEADMPRERRKLPMGESSRKCIR